MLFEMYDYLRCRLHVHQLNKSPPVAHNCALVTVKFHQAILVILRMTSMLTVQIGRASVSLLQVASRVKAKGRQRGIAKDRNNPSYIQVLSTPSTCQS